MHGNPETLSSKLARARAQRDEAWSQLEETERDLADAEHKLADANEYAAAWKDGFRAMVAQRDVELTIAETSEEAVRVAQRAEQAQARHRWAAEERAEKAKRLLDRETAVSDELDAQLDGAEKDLAAERETVASLTRQLHDARLDADMSRAELETEQPRPLTADDITDEMVDRARRGWIRVGGRDYGDLPIDLRFALEAALTPPPKRPEGAEELNRVMSELAGHALSAEAVAEYADRLAERGVRVTGGEETR